jgi:peptide/nickel transport system substrate-binding protein
MLSCNAWIEGWGTDPLPNHHFASSVMRSFVGGIGILLCALIVPGAAVEAKTLRIALSDDATTLDPHVADLIANNRLLHNIYDGLVTRDKDFKIAPALAVSWSQPDAKTWRFKLRPNVKIHDGSPFTADDVVFSLNRVLHPLSALRASVLGVASARRVDDLTVDFIMAEPNAVLLNHLVSFRIMSKAWSTKNGSAVPQNYKDKEETFAARNTNGTGPFRLVSRQPDVRTVLAEHRDWWGRAPSAYASEMGDLTQVEWMPIKSTATRIAALLSGTVDLVLDPPVQDRDRIKNTPGFKLQLGSEPRVFFLAVDVHRDELLYSSIKGKNPFKDLRVRQAMALAVDVDLLVKKVNRGYGRPTALIVGKEVQGYAAELDRRSPADVSRARKLMAEAGYAQGFEVTLDCLNQVPFSEFCQGILPMLAQIGIRTKLNLVSFTNIFPKLQKFDSSFYIMGYGAQPMDALAPMQSLLRSVDEKRSDVNNWGRYNNRQLDALFVKIGREQNMAARDALIREALMVVRDDLPVIPLIQTVHAWAMRSNVDAPFVPNSLPYFYRFSVK